MTHTLTENPKTDRIKRLTSALNSWTTAVSDLGKKLHLPAHPNLRDPILTPLRTPPHIVRDINSLNAGRIQIANLQDKIAQLEERKPLL
jgi:hypothetical protein